MADSSLSRIASLLALLGGVLLLAFGVLALIASSFGGTFTHWDFAYGGVLSIVTGIIAIVGSRSASDTVWAIVLIVIGLIGGGLGGLLVILGGILGLLSRA
jgi:hypothetical protein